VGGGETQLKALVTGGGGFLGHAIVRLLLARGDSVRSLARGDYPELTRIGVENFRGDVADVEAVARAAQGCDAIFHVAAKAGVWGTAAEYEHANIGGTRAVIDACRRLGIDRLIYTSTPSVVYGGGPIEGGDESLPYPARFEAHYPRTKAAAEKLVLAANGPALRTVSLRPHLIWGPGDNHLIPRMVARAKAGQLRKVGDGSYLVDSVYVDNAAQAHVDAADRLVPGSVISGKAYFITNGEPMAVGELIDRILGAAGLPPVKRSISPRLAYVAGAVLEFFHAALLSRQEPRMTRFLAKQLSTAHWFNISAARRELGYAPRVTIAEGLRRLEESFNEGSPRPIR
jgi:nucleoside-diphosphate-sugar epimerase